MANTLVLERLTRAVSPPPALDRIPRSYTDMLAGDIKMSDYLRETRPAMLWPAAVLVPVIDYPHDPRVLLTRRQAALRRHSGQIAFPGGRVDPDDIDPVAAALREAREEIGLAPEFVQVLGALSPYATGTGFVIVPIVGVVRPDFTLAPDEREVDVAFEVPLEFLLDPVNHHRHSGEIGGATREWWAMPYGEHYIWGATAGLVRDLYERWAKAG